MRSYRAVSFVLSLMLVGTAVALVALPAESTSARGVLLVLAAPVETTLAEPMVEKHALPAEIEPGETPSVVDRPPGVIANPPATIREMDEEANTGGARGEDSENADGATALTGTGTEPPEAEEASEVTVQNAHRLAEVLAAYHARIAALISAQKHYPEIARRLKHAGTVRLRFRLSADGELLASSVDSSSGYAELDEAALSAVRKVVRFPAFPHPLGSGEREFVVTLNFTLK